MTRSMCLRISKDVKPITFARIRYQQRMCKDVKLIMYV